ncbi:MULTISPECIES: hypothetical protein [Enterobacter]|jgi:hypothetical protein|nr:MULTISPECIES: hypothetical protein [Enterobacter]TOY99048.1 hypothetical protein DI388_05670 [Escherichia coli]ELN9578827.1 hypothetical protein [Enterobacter roggenkampii]ELT5303690.1 hypothetical protein [Enterobacter roggenkampii]EMF1894708.1 hypothetical protein [Enterobacter roggenkampii]KJM51783.1 hypothetical protein SS30_11070 [Enterobacter roggenkampii]
MTPNININELDNEKIFLTFLFIVLIMVFVFILYNSTKFINSLPLKEKKYYIKRFFTNISAIGVTYSILSSFLYINKGKDITIERSGPVGKTEPKLKNLNNYLEEEYSSAKTTRMIFINLFFISTISVICGFIWLDKLSYEVRITIACLYFGLSLFVLFVIKSCYSRTAVIMAILEDQQKKDDIKDFFIKYKKGSDLNERDIELIKIICVSRSEREKTAKHPYEIILKNISGSSLSFGNSKLKVSDEEKK